MPTSSSARKSTTAASPTAPTARPSASPLPPAARRPAHHRPSPTHAAVSPRGATPTELLPVRRDSSIGATSTNPRLRSGSVIEAAAAAAAGVHRSSSAPRPVADFHSAESKAAMRTLRLLFLPVLMRCILRGRRRRHWKDGEPPRLYTSESVVAAIASSKTALAEWPRRVLEQLADEATFHYMGPREFIVYAQESHVSCGIVVLLHGQLEERRPDAAGAKHRGSSGSTAPATGNGGSRPIHTQTHRLHKATDVLCVMPVLCEDRATSSLATREKDEADVAIISSRWFWEVYYGVAHSALPASDGLARYMKDVVAPHRRDIVMADYFPTSVVMLRSWMWPLLTASDRVKLCRAMEVRVLGVGEVLFNEGDYCPYIYFVRRGALTVIVKGEALAVLEAGACIGEESVLFHEKRNSSVVGSTICELYALHVRHLEHRLTKYPEVGQRVIAAAVARQLRWMEEGKTRDVFGLVSILSGVPCLGHSTDTMREELAQCAVVRSLPQGAVLATANTPCTSLFVLGRGSVALTTVVKPTAPSTAAAGGGESPRLGSAGRNAGLPPKRRPSSSSSSAANNNPRASMAGVAPLNTQAVAAAPEVRREMRSAGDFIGELCLKPHLWPFDVVCESTVNVWHLDREAILQVLEKNRADAQAMEVCRQGISLFRAQRGGEGSLIEGFNAPATPNEATNGRRSSSSTARRNSRAPSAQPPPAPTPAQSRRRSSSMAGGASAVPAVLLPRMSISQLAKAEDASSSALPMAASLTDNATTSGAAKGRSSVGAAANVELTPEQWTTYALTRLQEGLAKENAAAAQPARELRTVDKEVEKAMKEKVLRLIAVQAATPPNPADCDISGDGEELQAIIVEQLFLIPTEQQPRFIRQVNDSNVRLVTENDDAPAVAEGSPMLEEDELRDPWQSGEAPISVGGVMRLEDVNAAAESAMQMGTLASYSFQGAGDTTDSGAIIRSLGENMELSGQVGLSLGLGRSRRSMSVAALEDSGAGFMGSLGPRNSISRSHFVRPPSGMPISPRSNVRNELVSPRGMSAIRPGSSSEPRIAPPTRTRPASVDFNQFNKVGVDRSTSVLDRYVKIEDQNYFDDYVKVLPLQQDEMWAPDEVNVDDGGDVEEDEMSLGSMVLLLLHVRQCDYLSPEVLQRCRRPMVKVTLGQRVLVRTPVMAAGTTAPRWPIEESSFITFVRRGAEVVFAVCDADDESTSVYTATLLTASIHENGGVGQQALSLTEVAAAADSTSDGAAAASAEETSVARSDKAPRLTTTMLAVTASKYKALRQALKTRREKHHHLDASLITTPDIASGGGTPALTTTTTTTLYVQVMSVEGLKHRIEASVTVSFYNGGTLRQLLETSQVLPKTRSPAWPADKAFLKVCGEGGVLTFDLQHKGAVISSAEMTVDELAFGGVGLRRLPLLQAQTGSAVMGHLVICVLGATAAGVRESRSSEWVAHVAVEELTLSKDGFAITPDPFVVLRDGAGVVRLRTPLACGAFEAAWSTAEASCLLHCPRLSGSTATYRLEVCDSDLEEVIGRATVTVTERGLLDGPRREIVLDPPGSGVVRLRSLCLPVMELPTKKRASATVTQAGSAPPALTKDAAVLLVRMCGCDQLPGGATDEYQTDALGTLSVDRRQYLRTPLREGTTSPRWPFARSSVMLHIPSAELRQLQCDAATATAKGGSGAAKGVQATYGSHECRFAVYDGVVDEVNQIGQVSVPLEQLLRTATHTYPLFPRSKASTDAKRGSDGGNQSSRQASGVAGQLAETSITDAAAARDAGRGRAAERTVGELQVFTLLSRLDGQVEVPGVQDADFFDAADTSPVVNPAAALVPYYDPTSAAAAAAAASSTDSQYPQGDTVLLSVSNVCHVLPNASAKYIHLVVRLGPTPVLSVECQMGASSHVEWGLTDSAAAVARELLMEEATLLVELHAMDVVEGKGGEEAADNAAAAAAASVANITETLRQQTSLPAERVLVGRAEMPTSRLTAVGAGEVDVVTVVLEKSSPPSRPKSQEAPPVGEGKPIVSFCIIGNRV